ncbi:MAG: hypothetical protein JF593_13705 [Novosphingobium sp.]|nr:hypothetical protein [Novosphingobium sp.]
MAPAIAAELTVRVTDAAGHPVTDAVVTLRPTGAAAPAPPPGSGFRVEQRNIKFSPFVLVVPQGSVVAFPNLDTVKHHVYSFSPTKRFELKLFARGEPRSVTFDRPGIVAVGCTPAASRAA